MGQTERTLQGIINPIDLGGGGVLGAPPQTRFVNFLQIRLINISRFGLTFNVHHGHLKKS